MTQNKSLVIWQAYGSEHMIPLLHALSKERIRSLYVCMNMGREENSNKGWDIHEGDVLECRNFFGFVKTGWALRKDSVHLIQGPNMLLSFYLLLLTKLWNSRIFITSEKIFIDSSVFSLFKFFIYRVWVSIFGRFVNGFFLIGEPARSQFRELGVVSDYIFDFHYYLDEKLFKLKRVELPAPNSRVIIGFIGRIIELKRVHLLLEYASKSDLDFELHIVGDGVERERLTKVWNLPNVVWHGEVRHSDLSSVLRFIDVLVLPSRRDGWGVVATEALVSGCRVVVSDVCGCAEYVVRHGGHAFRVDKPVELFEILDQLVGKGPVEVDERLIQSRKCPDLFSREGARHVKDIVFP